MVEPTTNVIVTTSRYMNFEETFFIRGLLYALGVAPFPDVLVSTPFSASLKEYETRHHAFLDQLRVASLNLAPLFFKARIMSILGLTKSNPIGPPFLFHEGKQSRIRTFVPKIF